jgi:hypothetical protein
MRIAFLTMTFNNNYGGMLQAFTLMRYLQKLGHDVTLLNVQLFTPNYLEFIYSAVKRGILKYIFKRKDITWIFDPNYFTKRKQILEQNNTYFIDNYITPKTPKIFSNKELLKYFDSNYDAFVVGSDQVWRPSMFKFNKCAFFYGVTNSKIKISYSPSFGVDAWEYSSEETNVIKEQIAKFNAVSVREDSGVELCNKYLGVNAIHLLDPTFLMSKDDYVSLIMNEKQYLINCDIELVYYLLDENEQKLNFVNEFANINNFSAYKNYKSKVDESLNPYPSVFSWLDSFRNAKVVITDSYHGCVFSIIFNKPFLVFKNDFRGNARIESLLRKFKLENCVVGSEFDIQCAIQSMSYDWDFVNRTIIYEREKSNSFLVSNLSK